VHHAGRAEPGFPLLNPSLLPYNTSRMTTASPSQPKTKVKPSKVHNPDSFRMTIGEHLEDLRWRMIIGLLGFAVAIVLCVAFTERVIVFFTAPYVKKEVEHHLNPQMFYGGLTDVFMTYLKIWMISAAVLAGPWMLYQIWQFIAAGLYPHERKSVTRYIPMSIILMITGVVFVYTVVLPMSVSFFLTFGAGLPLPSGIPKGSPVPSTAYTPMVWPVLDGDPAKPQPGEVWINTTESRIKTFYGGQMHVMLMGSDSLLTPMLTLSDYIDLVLTFMLTFGLAFQLPLVVLALVSVGVVEVSFLKKQRKVVYFVMAAASAVLAPGEIISSMLSLLIPLMILYEFGLWLAQWRMKQKEAEEGTTSSD
jgi:Sec-independent protein secretion pathway component TatC